MKRKTSTSGSGRAPRRSNTRPAARARLELGERRPQGPAQRGLGHELGPEVHAADARAAGERRRALDDVLELAHVAGPAVAEEPPGRVLVEPLQRLAERAGRAGAGGGRPPAAARA